MTATRRSSAGLVGNLLDNAARHAAVVGHVSLAETTARRGWLAVADDGPGIPAAERERVFERFARLDDARTRDAGGTGLGLAIARDIVQRHGGTIPVEQAGATAFIVELPRHDD